MFPTFSTAARGSGRLSPVSDPITQQSACPRSHATDLARPEASPIPEWERLPREIQENIACRMAAADLAAFSSTSKSNLAIGRSPHVVIRQRPDEAMRSVWHLAKVEAAEAIATLVSMTGAERLDWGRRNAQGATLLMTALRHYSPETIDALCHGPVGLFAGVDDNGDNVLHYAVERADTARLERMFSLNPLLAAYLDMPNDKHCTPLWRAYQKRDDAVLAALGDRRIEDIDRSIDHAQACHGQAVAEDDVPLEGLAAQLAARVNVPPLTHVFPMDRNGVPCEGPRSVACMRGLRPTRQPEQSRMRLAFRAINDRESAVLDRVLSSMPTPTLRTYRDNLIRAVLHTAHFQSVRIVANVYGRQMFAPLMNRETALHLAASQGHAETVEWLIHRPGGTDALHWRDSAGRTPLLRAAEHANMACLDTLADHYPERIIGDRDDNGHGPLRILFQARPSEAIQLLCREDWTDRITPADNTDTLACAMLDLLEGHYDTVSIVCDEDLLAHMDVVNTLLSRPRGQIDVQANLPRTGISIIDVLRSGRLPAALQKARRQEQQASGVALEIVYAEYDNGKSLNQALAHL